MSACPLDEARQWHLSVHMDEELRAVSEGLSPVKTIASVDDGVSGFHVMQELEILKAGSVFW